MGIVLIVLKLLVGLLQGFLHIDILRLAPVVKQHFLVLGLNILVDIVVDIELGARRDDALHFGQQLVEGESFAAGYVVERFAAVDGLNDIYLVLRAASGGVHNYVLRTGNVVFLNVVLDEVDERRAVFLCLGDTDTHAAAELLNGAGVLDGHVGQGAVFKDDMQRELFVLGNGAEQAAQLGIEYFVASHCRCHRRRGFKVFRSVVAVVVVARYRDVVGFLDEFMSRRGELEHTVHLYLFGDELLEYRLP